MTSCYWENLDHNTHRLLIDDVLKALIFGEDPQWSVIIPEATIQPVYRATLESARDYAERFYNLRPPRPSPHVLYNGTPFTPVGHLQGDSRTSSWMMVATSSSTIAATATTGIVRGSSRRRSRP